MIFVNLLLLSIAWVIIIDFTSIIQDAEHYIEKFLKIRKAEIPKPFSCSMCMIFWSGLIYLILTGQFTLFTLCTLLIICFFSTSIYNVLYLVKNLIDQLIINQINKLK